MINPLVELGRQGQSVWYDSISRHLIASGELARLIDADGLKGMTSNPAIFEKAISGSPDYDADLARLAADGRTPLQIYETLAIGDIQTAADVLRPVYEGTDGVDGYVSLEVSPHLANDAPGTVAEARRLAERVDRANLMIKVPATPAGVSAIRDLIGSGLSVNATLLFAPGNYAAVHEACLAGLEALADAGGDLAGVASVASFFVSRIDVMVDGLLAERAAAGDPRTVPLQGRVAIANAKLAYAHFQEVVGSERWRALQARGARPQRLLWASTGVKNPDYRDTLYVEELIGPDTVNTMPEATFRAFREHGVVAPTLTADVDDAHQVMAALEATGISMQVVTDQLQADGVRLFVEPFDKLLAAIQDRGAALRKRV